MDITRYVDLSLKSVPRRSPIPPNSIACLQKGYDYDDPTNNGTMFRLCKNRQELVIEGPPLREIPGLEDQNDSDRFTILDQAMSEYVDILEDLIPTIEFGVTELAHLVPDPLTDGYQIILDYEKQLRQVSCPTWAPIIPIDEIEFTVWGPLTDRRGIRRGKAVDIFYAHDDLNMWRLNRAMYGLRRVDGLDLTFELYGHLINRDGQTAGLVTEAAWGRPIRPSDKEFVASELKRLESHGYLYGGCLSNSFLIADGKLRLLQATWIRQYSDPEEMRREAAFLHTQHLDQLFQEFEDFGPFGDFRVLPEVLTKNPGRMTYLRHSIPRSLWTQSLIVQSYSALEPRADTHHRYNIHDEEDSPKRLVSLRTRRLQSRPPQLCYRTSRRDAMIQDNDVPLSSCSRLRHRVFVSIAHPYTRFTPGRTFGTIHDSDSTESDIDTIRYEWAQEKIRVASVASVPVRVRP